MASKFKREFKNVVYNYSEAEAKVREATSNDLWGPSSALMSELADYTYHVQAYTLVMGMLWKRLNDHGKNWRHVYKSLIVLEYLIKGGSDRVAQQCKDNMFSIQTLKDFQYIDKDGKDQGANVREKAKQLVTLLKDERKIKEERQRALQSRERQQALDSNSPATSSRSGNKKVTFDTANDSNTDGAGRRVQPVEQARPGDENEEEMQLRLALQLSKEQADEEEKLRKQEEESLSAAIALSTAEQKAQSDEEESEGTPAPATDLLLDLDSSIKDPWSTQPLESLPTYDSVISDPWAAGTSSNPPKPSNPDFDPWGGGVAPASHSPAQTSQPPLPSNNPWDVAPTPSLLPVSNPAPNPIPTPNNPFDLSDLGLPPVSSSGQPVKIEAQFLGTNANLVDLDLLTLDPIKPLGKPTQGPSPTNPFGLPTTSADSTSTAGWSKTTSNPFDANKPAAPTLSQLAGGGNSTGLTSFGSQDLLSSPLVPIGSTPLPSNLYPAVPSNSHPSLNNQAFNPFS